MTDHVAIKVGGLDTRVATLADGTKIFRADPDDVTPVEICLVDNSGRQRVLSGFQSTILVMVPVGELGAVAFDPMFQVVNSEVRTTVDETGRPCFAQRPAMTRAEVFSMVQEILAKERSSIQTASPRDLTRLKLV